MTYATHRSFLTPLADKMRRLLARLMKTDENRLDYINGTQTLPPPLSKEEEPTVFEMLRYDPVRAKETLITRNLRLVVYIARKFESTGIDIEDLISIGTIGLIKAVDTFSPDKKIKLATYASRCIENEILMYLRKTAKLKAEVSFDEPLNTDWDGNELLLSDILGTEEDCIRRDMETEAEHAALHQAVARLNGRERNIMELRFGLNGKREHTQKEVAELIGISQSYISRLEKKILRKLADELREELTD